MMIQLMTTARSTGTTQVEKLDLPTEIQVFLPTVRSQVQFQVSKKIGTVSSIMALEPRQLTLSTVSTISQEITKTLLRTIGSTQIATAAGSSSSTTQLIKPSKVKTYSSQALLPQPWQPLSQLCLPSLPSSESPCLFC